MFKNKLSRYSRVSVLVLMTLLIQGCFHSEDTPVPDADPTGYYEKGKSTALGISDFQAVVKDNRIMMMSTTEYVLYDGSMSISGNDYTASVTVYKNGISVGSGSITGIITAGSSIAGDITGTVGGFYDGDFTVTYALANDTDTSSYSKTNATWRLTDIVVVNVDMVIDNAGNIDKFLQQPPASGYLFECRGDMATIHFIPLTNLYSISGSSPDQVGKIS